MFVINTYNHIGKAGLDLYSPEMYSITEKLDRADAVMVHSAPLHDVQFPETLKAIVRVGAGVNTIPVERCTEEGICVFNTPGGNANAVKELAIAAMITMVRNVPAASAWVKSLKTPEPTKEVEKGKEVFRGPEIMGKKIGVIGVGAIGSRMARACSDLGMEVVGYDPYLSASRKKELRGFIQMLDQVSDLYRTCDFITVHVPLNDQNRDMIGEKEISQMKDGVYLINYARGPIINNEAVVSALRSGKVKGLATDFPTSEQLQLDSVVATPHLGAGTPEADENCAVMAARQIMDYLENGNIQNSVNLPDVSFPRTDGPRITLIHRNRPGMLGTITETVSSYGINIENLVNRSLGSVAYTMLDFLDEIPAEILTALSSKDGILKARQL